MATVTYSVPEEVKEAFNEAFANENKSAIIARLMREAVEERRRRETRAEILRGLLARRGERPLAGDRAIRRARRAGRA